MLQEVNAAWETIRTGQSSSSSRTTSPPPWPGQESAAPPQRKPPPPPPDAQFSEDLFSGQYSLKNCPFKRCFARAVDTCLALAMVFVIVLVGYATSDSIAGWSIIAFVFLYPAIEGLLLAHYGTTPGKFMFGIRVLQINGQRAQVGTAIYRSYLVQLFGNALYIPILGIVANIALFVRLIRGRPAVWDKNCNLVVGHKPLGVESIGGTLLLGMTATCLFLSYSNLIKPLVGSSSTASNLSNESQPAASTYPPLPPGFVLDTQATQTTPVQAVDASGVPASNDQLPPGYQSTKAPPPPPPGAVLDAPPRPQSALPPGAVLDAPVVQAVDAQPLGPVVQAQNAPPVPDSDQLPWGFQTKTTPPPPPPGFVIQPPVAAHSNPGETLQEQSLVDPKVQIPNDQVPPGLGKPAPSPQPPGFVIEPVATTPPPPPPGYVLDTPTNAPPIPSGAVLDRPVQPTPVQAARP